jgi:DnaJ-class molecular chaperone
MIDKSREKPEICDKCDGRGEIVVWYGFRKNLPDIKEKCPKCKGNLDNNDCLLPNKYIK